MNTLARPVALALSALPFAPGALGIDDAAGDFSIEDASVAFRCCMRLLACAGYLGFRPWPQSATGP